jgi:LysR family glycine cleavage system transcriptional activator
MVRRLPPLNAVRAFEAAARHLSFTRAAAELGVTQAAISHQIRTLEEALGVVLFRRLTRGLVLTAAGQAFLPAVAAALDGIAEGARRVKAADDQGPLTVTTLASFAAKWLVPRLPRFQAAHPEIEVRLTTTAALVDFERQDVDVGIRFGLGEWPGLRAERLMAEDVFPVSAPVLADGRRAPATLEELRDVPLLHDDLALAWPTWLGLVGAVGIDGTRGTRVTDSGLVLQLAVDGHGVALARTMLAARDLREGRLVRLFGPALPSAAAYYIVGPPAAFGRAKVAAFRDWVFREAVAEAAVIP